MITIIILSGIAFMFGFINFYKVDNDFWESLIFGLVVSCVGMVLGVIIALIIPSHTQKYVDTVHLALLQDGSSLSGSFFLGSGSINGEMKYTYYYESDGGYRMGQTGIGNVLIKFTKDEPKLEIHKKEKTDALINEFSIMLDYRLEYIFYIPEGSIKQNYTLDAQ